MNARPMYAALWEYPRECAPNEAIVYGMLFLGVAAPVTLMQTAPAVLLGGASSRQLRTI